MSNGNLAFKITLDEYIEKYNAYVEKAARLDHPNESEEFYKYYAEYEFLDINKAKKVSNGDGTTSYIWAGFLDRNAIGVYIDDSSNYVIGARITVSDKVPDHTLQHYMLLAFTPLGNITDLLKKIDKHNPAFDNDTVLILEESDGDFTKIVFGACSKSQYKEMSKAY